MEESVLIIKQTRVDNMYIGQFFQSQSKLAIAIAIEVSLSLIINSYPTQPPTRKSIKTMFPTLIRQV